MIVILLYVYYCILLGMIAMFSHRDYARIGTVLFFAGVSFLAFYSGVLGPGVTQ